MVGPKGLASSQLYGRVRITRSLLILLVLVRVRRSHAQFPAIIGQLKKIIISYLIAFSSRIITYLSQRFQNGRVSVKNRVWSKNMRVREILLVMTLGVATISALNGLVPPNLTNKLVQWVADRLG